MIIYNIRIKYIKTGVYVKYSQGTSNNTQRTIKSKESDKIFFGEVLKYKICYSVNTDVTV